MPCGASQDGRVIVESSEKMWYAGGGNDKPVQFFCHKNPTVWKGRKIQHQEMSCLRSGHVAWSLLKSLFTNMGISENKFFRHLLRGWTFWNISWKGRCPAFIPYLADEHTNACMKCADWNNTCLLPCLSPDWVIFSLEVSQAYWKSCLSKVQPYSGV